jgi:hypothetical protein
VNEPAIIAIKRTAIQFIAKTAEAFVSDVKNADLIMLIYVHRRLERRFERTYHTGEGVYKVYGGG